MTNTLKEKLNSRITPDDVISAVIYATLRSEIPKNNSFLHKTVYTLKNEFPNIFSDFLFDGSGISPFSEDIDGVLFRLETACILSTTNPSYSIYIVNRDCGELQSSYDKLCRAGMAGELHACAVRLCSFIDSWN